MIRRPPRYPLFPYTALFRSEVERVAHRAMMACGEGGSAAAPRAAGTIGAPFVPSRATRPAPTTAEESPIDRKSTRLNSSHANISYAVFCLNKIIIVAVDAAD